MTRLRDYVATDEQRSFFEEKIYVEYFISTVKRTGRGGPIELMPVGTIPKAEFFKRHPQHPETYEREELSAMWYGFKLGLVLAEGGDV